MFPPRLPRPVPQRRRGQSLPMLAVGIAAMALLLATLARYRSRQAEDRPRRGTVYLGDERASLPPDRQAAARRAAQRKAQDQAAARQALQNRTTRAFSYAAASRIFAGPGSTGSPGLAWSYGAGSPGQPGGEPAPSGSPGAGLEDGAGGLASEEIVVRCFGTPDGDFVFHRSLGWLRFDGTGWSPVPPDALPAALRSAHPTLAGPALAARGGTSPAGTTGGRGPGARLPGSDGEAALPAWLEAAKLAAAGAGP